MLNAVLQGAIILTRGLGEAEVLVRQILLARQVVKSVYAAP